MQPYIPPAILAFQRAQEIEREKGQQQLQQMGVIQGILSRQRAQQQDMEMRGALSSLPPDATPEQQARALMPYHPDAALRIISNAQDRQASLEDRKAAREDADKRARDLAADADITKRDLAAQRAQEEKDRDAQRAADRLQFAQAMSGLRQPPAPSITTLVDPTDKNRMISVDTRLYKGGGIGSPGVIGIAGKEPSYAKRDEEKQAGVQNLKDTVSMLDGAYSNLERMGAGVSPTQGTIKNAYERVAASGLGQTAAGAVGTVAQTERDKIAMARANLMAAMKQATGMSAQALNSNAELMFYLQAATDPTKSREANRAALSYMDRRFKLGLGIKAPEAGIKALQQQAPKQSEGQIGGSSIDDLLKKYE